MKWDKAFEQNKEKPMPLKVVVKRPRILRFFWEDDGKPTAFFERNAYYYCQCCGALIADELGVEGMPANMNYCYCCGQRLWVEKW